MLSKKTIGFLIKIGIVTFALFFLYQQLTSKSNVKGFDIGHILSQLKQHYFVIGVVILMMFLNWFLESLKWRFLISKIEKITIKPNTMVVSNCAMEPIIVINTPCILSAFSKQKTLPAYSPTLFGVNADTVIPEKTALIDLLIVIFSIFEIKNLHFKDSKNQFKNIMRITTTITK